VDFLQRVEIVVVVLADLHTIENFNLSPV
jgi:hypothetical protein